MPDGFRYDSERPTRPDILHTKSGRPMQLKLADVPVGALLVDALSPMTPVGARILRSLGVRGWLGYLGPTTRAALEAGLSEGLGYMPVSECRHALGWVPSAALGAADGALARRQARELGLPPGVSTWCDLEGMALGTIVGTTSYSSAWVLSAEPDGDVPGGYVGAGVELLPQDLYLLPFRGYWRSCSIVPNVALVDYQIYQLYPPDLTELFGEALPFAVDLDVVQRDKRGRAPKWVVSAL